jgi:hypothetical protein
VTLNCTPSIVVVIIWGGVLIELREF